MVAGGPSEISTLLGLTGGDLIILPLGTSLAAYGVLCEFKAYMHLSAHRFFDGTEEGRGEVRSLSANVQNLHDGHQNKLIRRARGTEWQARARREGAGRAAQ